MLEPIEVVEEKVILEDDDDVVFHKEIDDWLDDPKGYQRGIHSYFD
jgi:hypothetical protein